MLIQASHYPHFSIFVGPKVLFIKVLEKYLYAFDTFSFIMNKEIINETVAFVKDKLNESEPGHDWWHIYRVWQLSKRIFADEIKNNSNLNNEKSRLIVELGALLHDIADYKFTGDEKAGERLVRSFLSGKVDESILDKVVDIINNISYKGSDYKQKVKFKELDIVQDADRLDAMGAIGIARAFSYGGFKKRPMYNPTIKAKEHMTKEEYLQNKGTTINHFYEKLLLLKDRMNTELGKRIAEHRDKFMREFLNEFYAEWNGKL